MTFDMKIEDIKIPFAISILSGILFLISGAGYSAAGVSTGYVLVLVGIIVAFSAIRMKKGVKKEIKDSSLTVLFFGILNIISFVFILSGHFGSGFPFISGFLASLAAVAGGCLGFMYSKN